MKKSECIGVPVSLDTLAASVVVNTQTLGVFINTLAEEIQDQMGHPLTVAKDIVRYLDDDGRDLLTKLSAAI
ncbi:MAG: hypothetical protein PW843_24315 [Azospirillaceae bacterium]|nr:hypothetical protein [Azospirillaceae bacterium]